VNKTHRSPEEAEASLTASLEAWNAEQRTKLAAEEAAKAARRANPKRQARAEYARAYRERNKEKLAAKAKARRERERLATQARREEWFGKPYRETS
jgi:hypothetical protein